MKITIVNGVIMIDSRILLLKKHAKDYWEFPGGKQKDDEQIEYTLKRELEEEIGIMPKGFEHICHYRFTFEHKDITNHSFLIISYEGEPRICEPEVFEKMEWLPLSSLEQYPLAPNVLETLRHME